MDRLKHAPSRAVPAGGGSKTFVSIRDEIAPDPV